MTALQIASESNPALALTTRRIVLAGFMGAGKSTTGRILAAHLGWAFLDLDHHLEQRTQSTIPDLFARLGEPQFRRLESSALASSLAMTSVVIALGGGTPEIHANRLLIEQAPGTVTIFLDAPFPVLFDRCVLQAIHRPILADPEVALSRFNIRLPLYRRLARFIQPTENLTPEDTVSALLLSLAALPPGKL